MTNMLLTFSNILSKLVENKNSIINCLITLQIFGLERFSSKSIFRCPCYEEADAGSFFYGFSFLLVPALVLLIVGYLVNPMTARLLTGLSQRYEFENADTSRRKSENAVARRRYLLTIFMRATIAPLAWISIGLLDGKYFACAVTSQPYLEKSCGIFYEKQGAVGYSMEFELNRVRSQIFGWGLMIAVFITGAAIYSWRRYWTSVSHWHKRYVSLTNQIEREEFEKLSAATIRDIAKANVKKFLEEGQSKQDFYLVTELKSKSSQPLYYSPLQEWCNENTTPPNFVSDASTEESSLTSSRDT